MSHSSRSNPLPRAPSKEQATQPDEANLLARLRAGDSQAFRELFEAHADRLYRLALSLVRDPSRAEDVVQETFLAALTHLASFEGRSRLSTWLYRVAYNASLSQLRQRIEDELPDEGAASENEDPVPMPHTLVDWDLSPEAVLASNEARAHLESAIAALGASQRAVFLLRDVEGFSTADTADALGLSEAAVKVRLHRARLTLREYLSSYFAERLAPKESRS